MLQDGLIHMPGSWHWPLAAVLGSHAPGGWTELLPMVALHEQSKVAEAETARLFEAWFRSLTTSVQTHSFGQSKSWGLIQWQKNEAHFLMEGTVIPQCTGTCAGWEVWLQPLLQACSSLNCQDHSPNDRQGAALGQVSRTGARFTCECALWISTPVHASIHSVNTK